MSPHSDVATGPIDGYGSRTSSLHSTPDYSSGGPVQTNGVHLNGGYADESLQTLSDPTHGTKTSYLRRTSQSEVHDLVCVGFGPASLAVAVALHDRLESGSPLSSDPSRKPSVLFLEKQDRFAWHAGMLLPGAKMQISFVKDMATLRDPRSHFTFLNYLQHAGRLVEFTNLGTFLPARVEYEDYLRWCASHFDDVVEYQREVVSVSPDSKDASSSVKTFTVQSRSLATGQLTSVRARNVLIAVGGQPLIPKSLPAPHPRVIHSSQYAYLVPRILSDRSAPWRVAVVGAGQSAAEIFNNLQLLYPNSKTWLVMRSEFLKPSDDSPFVNSIFNPSYTDAVFPRSQQSRRAFIQDVKATNYGVVRLELIEHLYETMYDQRREFGVDERKWPHRIMGGREIATVRESGNGPQDRLQLQVRPLDEFTDSTGSRNVMGGEELLDVDLVIAATGYKRNAHIDMLRDTWHLLPETASLDAGVREPVDGWEVSPAHADSGSKKLEVGRDYQVRYMPGAVAPDSGVWLQGCCEMTHGLSDTLLSVLATRSGEIVESIFPTSTNVKDQVTKSG